MAFFKGQGGRPKGAKNKSLDLHAKCAKVNLDVFERLLELAIRERDTPNEWSKLSQLAQYLYAKPRDDGERALTADDLRTELQLLKSSGNTGDAG